MSGATTAAVDVDLVRYMEIAGDLVVRMKMAAECSTETERFAKDNKNNEWEMISLECAKLGGLSMFCSEIQQMIDEFQNRFDDYSSKTRNLAKKRKVEKAVKGIKLEKRKIKLEKEIKIEDRAGKLQKTKIKIEDREVEAGETSYLSERIRASDDDILQMEAELKTTKESLKVVEEILKTLKEAGQFSRKAFDMVMRRFALRIHTLKANFVEVENMADVSTLKHVFMFGMTHCIRGVSIKFAIGSLAMAAGSKSVNYLCTELSNLGTQITDMNIEVSKLNGTEITSDAIDVKPGVLYELSVDGNGLCHFRQLTPAEALTLSFPQ